MSNNFTKLQKLYAAIETGNLDSINMQLSLLEDHIFDHSVSTYAIFLAIDKGRRNIIERLLEDPRINPAIENKSVIFQLIQEDRMDIVEHLLNDLDFTNINLHNIKLKNAT